MGIRQYLGELILGKQRVSVAELLRLGAPVWMNQNAEAFAKEGYKQNVVVFRCVDVVAKSLASIPLVVFQNDKKADATHPLVRLLSRPNPRTTKTRLVHQMAAFRLITGNSWLEKMGAGDNDETSAKNPPRELWVWPPYKMTPIVRSGRGNIIPAGYQYDSGQQKTAWAVDQVNGRSCMLPWMTFNPTNPWVGMSPIEAMARAVDQRNSADEWNQAMLQNSGKPSAMVTSDKPISKDNKKTIRAGLERHVEGPGNAGRTLIASGPNIKYQQLSLSPQDMDWLEGKNVASRDICSAFGVPNQLAGIQGDQTFANFAEARLALWEDTVLPLGEDFVIELNHWFAEDFPGSEIRMDLDKIPALAPRRAAKWETAQKSNFISTNEKRKLVGFDEIADSQGDGDAILQPGTMVPLEEITSDPGEFPLRLAGMSTPPAKLSKGEQNRLRKYLDELAGTNGNGR
jgi:HK97 family phage portal protein